MDRSDQIGKIELPRTAEIREQFGEVEQVLNRLALDTANARLRYFALALTTSNSFGVNQLPKDVFRILSPGYSQVALRGFLYAEVFRHQ